MDRFDLFSTDDFDKGKYKYNVCDDNFNNIRDPYLSYLDKKSEIFRNSINDPNTLDSGNEDNLSPTKKGDKFKKLVDIDEPTNEFRTDYVDAWIDSFLKAFNINGNYKYFDYIRQMRSVKPVTPNSPHGTCMFLVDLNDITDFAGVTKDAKFKKDCAFIYRDITENFDIGKKHLSDAVLSILKEFDPEYHKQIQNKLIVSITNFPNFRELDEITSEDINIPERIEGVVTQYDKDISFRITKSVYYCSNSHRIEVPGSREPKRCYHSYGKTTCESEVITEDPLSQEREDYFYIRIQQRQDRVLPRKEPKEMDIVIQGAEFVKRVAQIVEPGLFISVNGIPRVTAKTKGNPDFVGVEFEVSSIEIMPDQNMVEENHILDQIVAREIPQSEIKNHVSKLIHSICPHLFGIDMQKTAIALLLVGATPILSLDGSKRIRGELQILLFGDSETGKSDLLHYVKYVRPRAVYAMGRSSTAVGLTAGLETVQMVRNGHLMSVKRVAAGAYVIGADSIVCVDELEKREKKDFEDISHPMDDFQLIPLWKHGIHKDIYVNNGSLHAANPSNPMGKYDPSLTLYEQCNFAQWLLTRYDLIFKMIDDTHENEKTNAGLWKGIESLYNNSKTDSYNTIHLRTSGRKVRGMINVVSGQSNASVFDQDTEVNGSEEIPINRIDPKKELTNEYYSADYWKREIIFLQKIEPELESGSIAWRMLRSFWDEYNKINMLDQTSGNDYENDLTDPTISQLENKSNMHISAVGKRKIHSIIRLAKASARLHRRKIVSMEDMELAITIMKYSIAKLLPEKNKKIDPKFFGERLIKKIQVSADHRIAKLRKEEATILGENLSKFMTALHKIIFDSCSNCHGKGVKKLEVYEVGVNKKSMQTCLDCNGRKGKYHKFRAIDMTRHLEELNFSSSDVSLFIDILRSCELIQPSTRDYYYVTPGIILTNKEIKKSIKAEALSYYENYKDISAMENIDINEENEDEEEDEPVIINNSKGGN